MFRYLSHFLFVFGCFVPVFGISCVSMAQGAPLQDLLLEEEPNLPQDSSEIHKILAVLRQKPESTSIACFQALASLHKAQNRVQEIVKDGSEADVELTRDIAEASLSDSIVMCGTDAHTLCRQQKHEIPALNDSCSLLQREPGEAEEDYDIQ